MAVNLSPPTTLLPVAGVQLGSACAIKAKKRDDLTVIALPPEAVTAGVFTQNRFPAAPVTVCRAHLTNGVSDKIRALAINAGIANAGTLGGGLKDAQKCCRLLARRLRCQATQILPFSTGVIMERLPMQRYADGLERCVSRLSEDNWRKAASAIMTTDTVAKGCSRRAGAFTVTGIAKGSGMIHPNMATMLAFIATDAAISKTQLRRWQKTMVADTFNAISVDGDTSTNDSFILIATGKAGRPANKAAAAALEKAINEVAGTLAEAIVRDGEGAEKLLSIVVRGGKSNAICRRVADSVARSPLVKTALAASDANVGRLLMAIGNAGAGFDPGAVHLRINNYPVIRGGGLAAAYNEAEVARALRNAEVNMRIDIGRGRGRATIKTCDLTHQYITINADYRS